MTAQTVSNAVATRDEQAGPIKFMWSKRAHFAAVLPGSVDVEAFLGTAAGALYASDVPGRSLTLMRCARENTDSLFVALMECAALGHRPGTDEYYLTPRLDHGRPKVLGIEGYRGVIERMYRSGAVANVVVREVCENDVFDFREGEMEVPAHRFGGTGSTGGAFFGGMGKRGEMVGGYAYAKLTNGSYSRVVILTRDDVLAARDAGGYKPDDKFSPWNRMDGGDGHPEYQGRSMWWKTFAKRLEPWVPTSAEYRREQLRASAAAVSSGPRPAAELPAPPDGIVDAIVVDEPQEQPAPQLEQPSQRRQRGQRGQQAAPPPPEDAPWPDDAAPARPARNADRATGEVIPPAADDADPRAAVLAAFDALKVAGPEIPGYLTRLSGHPYASVDSLSRAAAGWFADRLGQLSSRDELEAAATAAEARREQDAAAEDVDAPADGEVPSDGA